MKISLTINGEEKNIDVDGSTPLLWAIRDSVGLKGTKFGCGVAQCGACTIHIDGVAVRSCTYPTELAEGKNLITIEGLQQGDQLHPVQKAWMDEIVPQCGYCQSGFIMATAALLKETPNPTDEQIDDSIQNICRCGTYYRIRKAIHKAAAMNAENQKAISEK